ncbi:MAG: M48 family metalloprotease [Chthonomonadetes bacterium]|nr:M48 family metalloprotease [Chthonomonadetes bacterium]
MSERWRQACQQVEVDICPIYMRLGRDAYTAKIIGTAPDRCYVYVPDVLLDVLSPVHLDCVLVHLACHLKLEHPRKWTKFFLQWWASWSLMAGAVFLMHVATGVSLTSFKFSATWLAAIGSVGIGLYHLLSDGDARHLAREQEFEADRLAVDVVQNMLTYIEALREQGKFQPLDFVHYVKEPTAEERQALIKASDHS